MKLCRAEEIAEGTARGFDLGAGTQPREVFLVRKAGQLHGYANLCPHLGTPLEFTADQFLDAGGHYILCSTHGALFRIEDGYCLAGPCMGMSLEAVALRVNEAGEVLLDAAVTSSR